MFNEGKNNPYNGLSEELNNKIKPLKERVVYIAKGVYNKKKKSFQLKEAVHIPNIDRIYDPGKEDWIDIALITGLGKEGVPQLQPIWLQKSGQNMFILLPGNALHEQMYQYLQVCNYVPDKDRVQMDGMKRDSQKEILCEIFDLQAEDRKDREFRKIQAQALTRATSMDLESARRILITQNKKADKMPPETVMNQIEQYAWDFPEKFMDKGEDLMLEVDDIIRNAVKDGIIAYDKKTGNVSWVDGGVITQLRTKVGGSWYQDISDWCINDNEGLKFLDSLRVLV